MGGGAGDGVADLRLGLGARGLGLRVERAAHVAGAAGDAAADLGDALAGGTGADLGLLEAHDAEADGDVAGVGEGLLYVRGHVSAPSEAFDGLLADCSRR